MAKFNEILAGRYNRFLQKLFQMKGGPPSAQLSSEITTNMQFFSGVENRWLEGWNRFACVSAQPATAAVASQIRIRNPKGSKVVVVIEKMTFSSSVTDNGAIVTQITGAVDFAGAPGNRCLDNRATGLTTTLGPVAKVSNQQAVLAASGGIIVQFNSLVSTPEKELIVHEDQELTLLPDDSITFFGTTLNCQVVVVIWWRERAMEESEQT